ncbi:hypothetical protein AB0D86_48795 [Streptomyces sp. NPDC048324]|uniref:hypothetical protein n=1 Tax=Streptomyces sp. NPDC048324 TaxID=3157205 RepID=UPI00342BFC00
MATPLQQSTTASTTAGINALHSAHQGIQRCKNDVDTTAGNLAVAYSANSADGREFQNLLTQWDGQAQIILNKLQGLIDRLTQTLQTHNTTQSNNTDMIRTSTSTADSAYNQLT